MNKNELSAKNSKNEEEDITKNICRREWFFTIARFECLFHLHVGLQKSARFPILFFCFI